MGKLIVRGGVRVLALTLACSLAYFANIDPISLVRTAQAIVLYLAVFVVVGLAHDLAMRNWRRSWRFTSLNDILLITRDSSFIVIALLIAVFVVDRGDALPRSALVFTWLLDIGLFGAVLIARRVIHENTLSSVTGLLDRNAARAQPLMLMGRLDSADAFLRQLARNPRPKYRAVGLISPHAGDVRYELRGVRALGDLSSAGQILEDFAADPGDKAVVFLDETLVPADLDAEVLARLKAKNVALLRTENRMASLDTPSAGPTLRELDFNELLSRPPVHLDRDRIRKLIAGKRVLVTGAGGSIGSEICRQAAGLSCAHLAMVDNSEFSLFSIDQEIAAAHPTLSRAARLCDVRDADRIRAFFEAERPEIVFHAAALKHVPLMEAHPADSALTNVIGSANVADAAVAAGVTNFVFISTDKAVDPPNVMGATKRLAERVVCQRRRKGGGRFNVVRFGNVLGSAGSVVPTFLAQIERGGPVTLTHPDIERYFMTIPEAVELVLHATAKSDADDIEGVLVLDMGQPVRIVELARRLIELHGKRPGADIEIRVTGLRPGEKMTEELVDRTEEARPCDPGVMEVVDANAHVALARTDLRRLETAARAGDDAAVREIVFRLLAVVREPAAPGPRLAVVE